MKKSNTNKFLERVINIDFKKVYTKKVRILCHVSMWVFFFILQNLNSLFGYQFSLLSSILLSIRMTACNMIVFYLLFYIIIPYTLNRKYFLYFILSLPILIVIWLFFNHIFYVIIYESKIKIDYGILDDLIQKNHKKTILDVISLKSVLGHLLEIVMALAPFLFIKIGFDLTRLYSRSVKYISKIESLNSENLKMENKFLLTQLNPHFLFNTLNNIYGLSIKKDDATPELILQLSDIMRYTLYDADADYIDLNKELKFTENYFEMERMRYSSKFNIEKNINISATNSLKIAPLIFFVFVENAFKYGLKSQHPFLKITLENKDKFFYFAVENDKPANNSYKNPSIGGIGIENVKRRLELIYPKKHTLKIIDDDDAKFIIELNIELNE